MMLGLLWMIIRLVGYIVVALIALLLIALAILLAVEGYVPWYYLVLGAFLGFTHK